MCRAVCSWGILLQRHEQNLCCLLGLNQEHSVSDPEHPQPSCFGSISVFLLLIQLPFPFPTALPLYLTMLHVIRAEHKEEFKCSAVLTPDE